MPSLKGSPILTSRVKRLPPQHQLEAPAKKHAQEVDVSNQIWEDLSPWAWRNSIYTDEAASNCMGMLFKDEVTLFETLTFPAGAENTTIIEVGCGTAELFGKLSKSNKFQQLVGVEISQNMVNCAYEVHPHLRDASASCTLVAGNAVHLGSIIEENNIPIGPNPIVCILMNTYGILPEPVRALALEQMWQQISKGGTLVLGCWNKAELRVGCANYYTQNPQLCGECSEADFDFEAGVFRNERSGYSSHWWDEAMMRRDLEAAAPFEVTIKFVKHGVGIFALGRRA